ncbi:puratrophin-1-like protein [Lasius niger]|uniref:Puratrophin-1-like protein n=1 Tax=Lasius niger TaxID=67767 RepID=A0A0J7P0W9_LASNI|nr:puratrophin-1-like protein [Lasius niger]
MAHTKLGIVTVRHSITVLCRSTITISDRTKDGFTIFILNDSKESLEFVDKMFVLLQGRINVAQTLVFRNAATTHGPIDSLLPLSNIQTVVVNDATLAKYISRREENHDQMQWIAFYKEYDSLMTEWQSAGRRLALEMSELKECASLSGTLTPLGRLLTDPTLRRTSRDAEEAIATLEERAAPLLHIEHVRLSVKRARRLVEEVGKAATRLESSFESRRATIRNLAVLRSIEDQAHELIH